MNRNRAFFSTAFLGACALATAGCLDDAGGSGTGGDATTTSALPGGSGGGAGSVTGGAAGSVADGGEDATTGNGGAGAFHCEPADCPPPSDECHMAVCLPGGICAQRPRPDGTSAGKQISGDCKASVCMAGALVLASDDADVHIDGNECTADVCNGGVPSNPARAKDAACGTGGTSFCDGSGQCSECTAPSQCPGTDTECQSRTCEAGACGVAFAPKGTPTAAQTVGDCQVNQCNGAGQIESVAHAADIEDDANPCTGDACDGAQPSHPPKPLHTACGEGLLCNSASACVGCLAPADCGPSGNACLVVTCFAGTCGTAPKPDGAACDDGTACTQSDTCQAGACTGASPVLCGSLDQCHAAGACDPSTGVCSNPSKPDGAPCDDGLLCTQSDTCQAGACAGASPVVCVALDQCHKAGSCLVTTGACTNPLADDGASCNDGDLCTLSDTCQAGACAAGSPMECAAQDECHVPGACDPSTGVCSNPSKPDGAACKDGDACTHVDSCLAGACVGSKPVVCEPVGPCQEASCDPESGLCATPDKADGSPCDDGDLCTQSDTCQAGACTGADPVVCAVQNDCQEVGTCEPADGLCTNVAKATGTVCAIGGVPGECAAGSCWMTDTYATASGLGVAIPESPSAGTQGPMACSGLPISASGAVGGVRVTVSMTHTFVADLTILLVSPTGTVVMVMNTGDSSNLDIGYPITYRDDSLHSPGQIGALTSGNQALCRDDLVCDYAPAEPLSKFNGETASGTWQLCVGDDFPADTGSIDQVTLTVLHSN